MQINSLQHDFGAADAENAALRAQNMKMAQQIVALESEDLQQQYMDLMSENEELVRQKLEALQGQSSLEVRVGEMVVKNASLSAELVQARVEQGVLHEVSQVELGVFGVAESCPCLGSFPFRLFVIAHAYCMITLFAPSGARTDANRGAVAHRRNPATARACRTRPIPQIPHALGWQSCGGVGRVH